MSYRSVALAVAAVVASVAAVTIADDSPTVLPLVQASATKVPPREAALACPSAPAVGHDVTSLFAVSPTTKRATGPAADSELTRLRATQRPVISSTTKPKVVLEHTARAGGNAPVLASASGRLAPGATAASSSVFSSARTSGLATTWCGAGSNDWWFSAVDTSVGATSRLVLSNPTPAVAVVDLALFGHRGPIEKEGARGIAVAPFSERSLDLARFAPGVDTLTVNVHATRGSVVAAVLTQKFRGIAPAGSDWVTPSASPTTDVVINPAPRSAGVQRLVLTNTSAREALVHVQLFDASGTFTPTKFGELRIEPGAVVVKDLSRLIKGGAAGVRVTGNVPLTGAITTAELGDAADFTVSTSSVTVTAPVVVPLVPDTKVLLLLTTPERIGASVRIRAYDAAGARVGSQAVNVKGAAITTWLPPNPKDTSYLVLSVRAGHGVQGIAAYRSSAGVASLSLLSGVWSIKRPAVLPAP